MLPNKRLWTHFSRDFNERSILPSGRLPLLELTMAEGEENFSESRDQCRAWLKDLQCEVVYTDIYGSVFECYLKDLSWYGRNLKNKPNN